VLTLRHFLLGSEIVSLLKLAVDRYNAIALGKFMPPRADSQYGFSSKSQNRLSSGSAISTRRAEFGKGLTIKPFGLTIIRSPLDQQNLEMRKTLR
jgi:hypothetical protein